MGGVIVCGEVTFDLMKGDPCPLSVAPGSFMVLARPIGAFSTKKLPDMIAAILSSSDMS